ncbi:MAG: hypothetical protein JWM34_3727 [Ilumatobacteraceae bacterium]|nr:hypothetical protein [Ilumatobacteraceae bacterium]
MRQVPARRENEEVARHLLDPIDGSLDCSRITSA